MLSALSLFQFVASENGSEMCALLYNIRACFVMCLFVYMCHPFSAVYCICSCGVVVGRGYYCLKCNYACASCRDWQIDCLGMRELS